MKIDQISATAGGGQTAFSFSGGVAAATAAVNDASGATPVGRQLDAYHALSGRWAGASHGERAALTHALTESPFAKTIQTAVNTFTRAAWPGADAAPPVPQQRMKEAFDGLSSDHQQIIASLQVGMHCTGEVFIAEATRLMPDKVIRPYVGTQLVFDGKA